MALYIDSAYLNDIAALVHSVPLAGVTTNPSILLAAHERGQRLDELSLLKELVEKQEGTIFMQPGAIEEEEMHKQALAFIEMAPSRVLPKIPMTEAGMRVALRLQLQKRAFAFTAVTSVAQAYTAAMAGASFIIPYYNRLLRAGIDANERIAHMAAMLRHQTLPTRILAASLKSPAEVGAALVAGAHDLTVPPQLLLELVRDPQSELAVQRFEQDWRKMKML